MKNKLADLNNHLFMQLERLSDEDLTKDKLEHEVARSKAIVDVSDQIVSGADLQLKGARLVADHGAHMLRYLPSSTVNSVRTGEPLKAIEGEKEK